MSGKYEPIYNNMLSHYGVSLDTVGSSPNLYIGQQERTDELNTRIVNRMFPDVELRPNFGPRPVSTKYSLFPIVDSYSRTTEPYKPYLDYYPEIMFNPGNAKAPIHGFLNKIDLESELRNQGSILTKNDLGNNKHIPSLESDMYIPMDTKSPTRDFEVQPHPLLFSPFMIGDSSTESIPQSVGVDRFHNHTRTQLRSSA